jgi:hypothetical protein
VLDNVLEVEHRFLGPKVRRVFVPEDGPVDQFATLGVPMPNAVMARDASSTTTAASTDPASTCAANDQSGVCLKNVTNSTFTLPIALGIA